MSVPHPLLYMTMSLNVISMTKNYRNISKLLLHFRSYLIRNLILANTFTKAGIIGLMKEVVMDKITTSLAIMLDTHIVYKTTKTLYMTQDMLYIMVYYGLPPK